MPAIIQDEKQAAALKEIEQDLLVIEALNTSLIDKTSYSINAVPEKGKAVKIELNEKDAEKIKTILSGYKKKLSKEILSKASQYRIALSEKEMSIL